MDKAIKDISIADEERIEIRGEILVSF